MRDKYKLVSKKKKKTEFDSWSRTNLKTKLTKKTRNEHKRNNTKRQ